MSYLRSHIVPLNLIGQSQVNVAFFALTCEHVPPLRHGGGMQLSISKTEF